MIQMRVYFWSLFSSVGLHVCLQARSTLSGLLLFCSMFWKWEVWGLQLSASFLAGVGVWYFRLSGARLSCSDLLSLRPPTCFMFLSAFRLFWQDGNYSFSQPLEKSESWMLDICSALLFPSLVRSWGLGICSPSCSVIPWRRAKGSKWHKFSYWTRYGWFFTTVSHLRCRNFLTGFWISHRGH